MDQSLVHMNSWGNSYGPMVPKVLLKFPPTLALVHGWLFPDFVRRCATLLDSAPRSTTLHEFPRLSRTFHGFRIHDFCSGSLIVMRSRLTAFPISTRFAEVGLGSCGPYRIQNPFETRIYLQKCTSESKIQTKETKEEKRNRRKKKAKITEFCALFVCLSIFCVLKCILLCILGDLKDLVLSVRGPHDPKIDTLGRCLSEDLRCDSATRAIRHAMLGTYLLELLRVAADCKQS